MGKYESPKEDTEDGVFRSGGIRGSTRSSSSVEASVAMVGLVMEAVDEGGSRDAVLLRIDGIETRERVRKGHEGGDSGETGLNSS